MKIFCKISLLSFLVLFAFSKFAFSNYNNQVISHIYEENIYQSAFFGNDTINVKKTIDPTVLKEFEGVLVIDGKVETDISLLSDSTFSKKVEKFTFRKKPTDVDIIKFGPSSSHGIIFIVTKTK